MSSQRDHSAGPGEPRKRDRTTKCPHCGAWAPCNDQEGRIAAYMVRKGRGDEWRKAIGAKRAAAEMPK